MRRKQDSAQAAKRAERQPRWRHVGIAAGAALWLAASLPGAHAATPTVAQAVPVAASAAPNATPARPLADPAGEDVGSGAAGVLPPGLALLLAALAVALYLAGRGRRD